MTANPDPPEAARAKVILYVDDSAHWHDAARLVGEYARQRGGDVVVVSALLLPGSRQRALEEASRLLALPPERVSLVGKPGLIEYVLPDVAREQDASVVVVGRLGSADRLTSGLIAYLIAKRTPASVLIARGRPKAIRKMLVCTEGPRHGSINFERAADIAEAFGAQLDVLHVVSQMGITMRGKEELAQDLRDFVHSDAPVAEHLRQLEARLAERGLRGRVIVRSGLVVDEVLAAVHEGGHDLLVIGAHDVKGRERYLYEDVAGLILRASPVSTLVIRDDKRRA